jgi:ubiquinone/menaquinone biosynthesis C-methylase UbiE
MTDRPRPRYARTYAKASAQLDDAGLAALRTELLAPLRGEVVEIGAGDGRNFARYPAAVTSVIAVEPEPYLRERASERAPAHVTVGPGLAEALPLPSGSADHAVLCLVLCSVPHDGALAEVRRVLRPGGTVRFLEHTRADTRGLRTVQRIADATLWPRLTGGCHTSSDPVGALRRAGFVITEVRRLRFPDGPTTPTSPHVLGTAMVGRDSTTQR